LGALGRVPRLAPMPSELGLLANAGLILPPTLYRRSCGETPVDPRQAGAEAFKNRLLSTMARPCRELAIAERTELTAEGVARDREGKFIPGPLGQIGRLIAYDAMR
jgi:hypothetical protein